MTRGRSVGGEEVATPVWFAAAGGRLRIVRNGNSGNVHRTPNAFV
jgi:hypothetical protein